MSYVLTLVASPNNPDISHELISTIQQNINCSADPIWLYETRAIDLPVSKKPDASTLETIRNTLKNDKIDLFITLAQTRRKKLLLADMDSTIVTGETLDDLAAHVGLKDKVSAITTMAMAGELDFHEALHERVALLKDLPLEKIKVTLEKTHLNSGAKTFVRTMKKHGATCVLVSGGFTFFTEVIAAQCGFHAHHGNILEISNNKLLGTVSEPILDKHAKVKFLEQYLHDLTLNKADALTIGDGANDIPMLQTAGLGIGYKPKPAVAATIENLIIYGDLTAALYAQGYKNTEFL